MDPSVVRLYEAANIPIPTINLTSEDPVERLQQFVDQTNAATPRNDEEGWKRKLKITESSREYTTGVLCSVTLTETTSRTFTYANQIASRSYYVSKAKWGNVEPRKIVYALILDELGLAPEPEASPPTEAPPALLINTEEAEKTRDMAFGMLNNLSNPDFRPTDESVAALLRQVGKLGFSALKSLERQS